MKSPYVGCALLAAALGGLLVAMAPGGDAKPPEKVTVRPRYEEGRVLRYNLKLSGAAAWAPNPKGIQWGRMATDLTAVLKTKTIRDTGACTFELLGEHLRSAGQGPEGKIELEATREKVRIRINDRVETDLKKSPLARPMTMTFGPLGAFRYGTGLAPLAPYLLAHVDRRFWTLLTVAPLKPVGPGDSWEDEFDLAVPGGKGTPLHLKGQWKCLGWQTYRRQKVLAFALSARLTLKDSDLLLKNGDRVHVTSGTYAADGKVLWDVEHGQLCSASAEQKLLVKADKPVPRALRSEVRCTLSLLQARTGEPKK